MTSTNIDQQSLQNEIASLERQLRDARAKLNGDLSLDASTPANDVALHALLLLSDSALPLGSFAFSSGLESYLAHHRPSPPSASQVPSFHAFLRLSLCTLASTALPYVLAAYRDPENIETLDNDFDASTPCTVARRASVTQGRALLAIWDRSFRSHYTDSSKENGQDVGLDALTSFQALIRGASSVADDFQPNGHLAPLWGLTTRILHVPLHEAAYLFMFSHARTIISAAVRASVLGPYQAQSVLASQYLQERIRALVEEMWDRNVEDAGQTVPVMDLWVGRHEKLYSRIFNS